jgi:hypothetical protein
VSEHGKSTAIEQDKPGALRGMWRSLNEPLDPLVPIVATCPRCGHGFMVDRENRRMRFWRRDGQICPTCGARLTPKSTRLTVLSALPFFAGMVALLWAQSSGLGALATFGACFASGAAAELALLPAKRWLLPRLQRARLASGESAALLPEASLRSDSRE